LKKIKCIYKPAALQVFLCLPLLHLWCIQALLLANKLPATFAAWLIEMGVVSVDIPKMSCLDTFGFLLHVRI